MVDKLYAPTPETCQGEVERAEDPTVNPQASTN
jgi:hypothetical protein